MQAILTYHFYWENRQKKNEEFVILEGAAILTCYISFLQEKEQKIVVSLIQQKKEKKDCFATIVWLVTFQRDCGSRAEVQRELYVSIAAAAAVLGMLRSKMNCSTPFTVSPEQIKRGLL